MQYSRKLPAAALENLTIEGDFWDDADIAVPVRCWKKLKEVCDSKGSVVRKIKLVQKKRGGARKLQNAAAPEVRPPEPSSSAPANSNTPNVALTLKHFQRRRENGIALNDGKRLYLRVGDEVNHRRYEEWGIGVVMECMTSSVPGGTCLVRVRFQDGQLRCFNNDLDNEACCYYFGVRRYWNPTHGVDAIRERLFGRG
jgi:hypothetical protein